MNSRVDRVTKDEVLKVLKIHSIENNDSLIKDLGLATRVSVRSFDPYDYQLTLLTDLLNKVLIDGERTLVLNIPTGGGKSYLSMALAVLLDYYGVKSISPVSKTFAITFRNNLFSQYINSFKYLFSIKGKGNYNCLQDYGPITSDTLCIKKSSKDCKVTSMCEYFLQRSNFYKSKALITNYNWFIYNFNQLGLSTLTGTLIFDEVHTLFDIIDEIFNIDLSKVHEVLKVIYEYRYKNSLYESSGLYNNLINSNYSNASLQIKVLGEYVFSYPELNEYIESYESVKTQINLLEVIQEFRVPHSLSRIDKVKYVFRKLADLGNDNHVRIFMSATITEEFYNNNFNTAGMKYYYYSMDPIFKKENRKVYTFKNLPNVNFNSLNNPSFVSQWNELMIKICGHYPKVKGFVYANSYSQVALIKKYLYDKYKDNKSELSRFIINDKSTNAESTLEKFLKDRTNKVLISPIIREGMDFADDISRFQIIMKIPLLHSSVISEYGEDYYYQKAAVVLLQIIGRSVRTPSDWADSFIIDNSVRMLYRYLPKWFNESVLER